MSLGNIVDSRTDKTIEFVNAVAEPQWEALTPADHEKIANLGIRSCDWKYDTTYDEAVEWVSQQPVPMTLFVYDHNSDPIGLNPTE